MTDGPFKCKQMKILVDHPILGEVTVGYVQVLSMELAKKGGVEVYYKNKGHQKGLGKAIFRVKRWFMTDTDKDLFFDMYNDDINFSLIGEINKGWFINPYIKLKYCEIYKWIPVTGIANDVIAEEIIGESSDWEFSEGQEAAPCHCEGEQITNGGFELGDFTGWTTPNGDPPCECCTSSECSVVDYEAGAHSGTHYAWLQASLCDENCCCICQEFGGEGIGVSYVTEFSMWLWCDCSDGAGSPHHLNVKVYYTDDTSQLIQVVAPWNTWTKYDLTAQLQAGKCIRKICIYPDYSCSYRLDDVTLTC